MTMRLPGTLRVSNDCISDLAGYAALEAYGVVGMACLDANEGLRACFRTTVCAKALMLHHKMENCI